MATENGPFIKACIYRGFSIAMFDYQRVVTSWNFPILMLTYLRHGDDVAAIMRRSWDHWLIQVPRKRTTYKGRKPLIAS